MQVELGGLRIYAIGPEQRLRGRQWLTDVSTSSTDVWRVVLADGPTEWPQPDTEWVAVASASRTLSPPGGFSALIMLLNYTTPTMSERAGSRYERAAMEHLVMASMNDRSRWQTVEWRVDGVSLDASIVRFADAWAGYVEMPDATLSVFATSRVQPTIGLTRLARTNDYGFDQALTLTMPDVLITAHERAWGHARSLGPGWPKHADHALKH